MTTPTKALANRKNAALSTGPATPEGKAVAAANATGHGVFSTLPVVAGESSEGWAAHVQGVLFSLEPANELETTLAERAASLLWRMGRLARYEAETTAAAWDLADTDPKPDVDARGAADKLMDKVMGTLPKQIAEYDAALALIDRLDEANDDANSGAWRLLESAMMAMEDLARVGETWHYDHPRFRSRIGVEEADGKVDWTPCLVIRAFDQWAGKVRVTPDRFRELVRGGLERSRAEAVRMLADREERDRAKVRRERATRQAVLAKCLAPPQDVADKVQRYEAHLNRQLKSTLETLERLQALRRQAETRRNYLEELRRHNDEDAEEQRRFDADIAATARAIADGEAAD